MRSTQHFPGSLRQTVERRMAVIAEQRGVRAEDLTNRRRTHRDPAVQQARRAMIAWLRSSVSQRHHKGLGSIEYRLAAHVAPEQAAAWSPLSYTMIATLLKMDHASVWAVHQATIREVAPGVAA